MEYSTSEQFITLPESHHLDGLVGPLLALKNGIQERMDGTAFVIAPGWAITATHVVDHYLNEIQNENMDGKRTHSASYKGKFSFFMLLVLFRRDRRNIHLRVTGSYSSRSGDITLLRLANADGVQFPDIGPYPTLRFIPPNVGTQISAVGYPSGVLKQSPDGVLELHTWSKLSLGVVKEVHLQGRDSTLINYPCLHINARLDGGMSGGPVLDENGYVCGVISKSYDLFPDDEPISYAALLLPAAVISISDQPGLKNDTLRFYDILKRGQINSIDGQCVNGGFDQNGKFFVQFNQQS